MREATDFAYECLDALVQKVIDRVLPANWSVYADKRVAVGADRINYYNDGILRGPPHFAHAAPAKAGPPNLLPNPVVEKAKPAALPPRYPIPTEELPPRGAVAARVTAVEQGARGKSPSVPRKAGPPDLRAQHHAGKAPPPDLSPSPLPTIAGPPKLPPPILTPDPPKEPPKAPPPDLGRAPVPDYKARPAKAPSAKLPPSRAETPPPPDAPPPSRPPPVGVNAAPNWEPGPEPELTCPPTARIATPKEKPGPPFDVLSVASAPSRLPSLNIEPAMTDLGKNPPPVASPAEIAAGKAVLKGAPPLRLERPPPKAPPAGVDLGKRAPGPKPPPAHLVAPKTSYTGAPADESPMPAPIIASPPPKAEGRRTFHTHPEETALFKAPPPPREPDLPKAPPARVVAMLDHSKAESAAIRSAEAAKAKTEPPTDVDVASCGHRPPIPATCEVCHNYFQAIATRHDAEESRGRPMDNTVVPEPRTVSEDDRWLRAGIMASLQTQEQAQAAAMREARRGAHRDEPYPTAMASSSSSSGPVGGPAEPAWHGLEAMPSSASAAVVGSDPVPSAGKAGAAQASLRAELGAMNQVPDRVRSDTGVDTPMFTRAVSDDSNDDGPGSSLPSLEDVGSDVGDDGPGGPAGDPPDDDADDASEPEQEDAAGYDSDTVSIDEPIGFRTPSLY